MNRRLLARILSHSNSLPERTSEPERNIEPKEVITMYVRSRISGKIFPSVEPIVAAILVDAGIVEVVSGPAPAPAPVGPQWSAIFHEGAQRPLIRRINGTETTFFDGRPDPDRYGQCPDSVVREFERLVERQKAQEKADFMMRAEIGR
jgi:hypothetical protein